MRADEEEKQVEGGGGGQFWEQTVLHVPEEEEGGLGGLPNIIKEDEETKEEMEGKLRDEW